MPYLCVCFFCSLSPMCTMELYTRLALHKKNEIGFSYAFQLSRHPTASWGPSIPSSTVKMVESMDNIGSRMYVYGHMYFCIYVVVSRTPCSSGLPPPSLVHACGHIYLVRCYQIYVFGSLWWVTIVSYYKDAALARAETTSALAS